MEDKNITILDDSRVDGTGRVVYLERYPDIPLWQTSIDTEYVDGVAHGRTYIVFTLFTGFDGEVERQSGCELYFEHGAMISCAPDECSW